MLICYGFCGSFCTVSRSIAQFEKLAASGVDLLPVASFNFASASTRFGSASSFRSKIETVCRRPLVDTLVDAEPIGPVLRPDAMIIAPLTGNSLSKLRHGVYDTPVTLAAKACLRSGTPLLLALATNDALSSNFENLAALYNRKNVFFVPLRQDDPAQKPFSAVADFDRIPDALSAALNRQQLLPLFS